MSTRTFISPSQDRRQGTSWHLLQNLAPCWNSVELELQAPEQLEPVSEDSTKAVLSPSQPFAFRLAVGVGQPPRAVGRQQQHCPGAAGAGAGAGAGESPAAGAAAPSSPSVGGIAVIGGDGLGDNCHWVDCHSAVTLSFEFDEDNFI